MQKKPSDIKANRCDAARHDAQMRAIRPLLLGEWADICVKRDGQDYYLTQSSGEFKPGMLIWHSRDLISWEPLSYAVPEFDGQIWTTDLVKDEGRWRGLFLSDWKCNHIVEAETPAGSWTRPRDWNVHADTIIAHGPDGERYAYHNGKTASKLGSGLTVEEGPVEVYEGEPIPEEYPVECFCLEAPKMLYREGWWHFMNAQGGTFGPSTSHMIVSARSRDPFGPFENSPHNPIARTCSPDDPWWSIGHGELVDTPDGHWFCIFHGYPRHNRWIGRSTLIAPVEWTEDGWYRFATEWPAAYDRPFRIGMPLSDDFTGATPGVQWQSFGPFDSSRYRVGDGELRVKAPKEPFLSRRGHAVGYAGDSSAIHPGTSSPLTIQPRDLAYEVTVEIEARGKARAGLGLFTRENEYIGEFVDADGAITREQMKYRKYVYSGRPAHAGASRVRLRIVQNQGDAGFFYYHDGGWRRITPGVIATMNQPQPYPVRPALFVIGEDGEGVFRNFTYRPLRSNWPGLLG